MANISVAIVYTASLRLVIELSSDAQNGEVDDYTAEVTKEAFETYV